MILRFSFTFALKRIELGLAIENAEVWIRISHESVEKNTFFCVNHFRFVAAAFNHPMVPHELGQKNKLREQTGA